MIDLVKGWLALACAASTLGAAQPYVQRDFGQVGSAAYRPLFAWCDGPDRVVAVSSPAASLAPNGAAPVSVASFAKTRPQQVNVARYELGPPDGAAGSVYYGLRPVGSAASTERNFIHVGNIQSAGQGYTFTRVVEVASNGASLACRSFTVDEADPASNGPTQGTVFAGASAKRSVWIQRLPSGRFEYRSFDYGGGGVRLTNGTRARTNAGGLVYAFRNGGYTYRVEVGPTVRPSAKVVVTRNGRTLLTEGFRFYSDARPKGE